MGFGGVLRRCRWNCGWERTKRRLFTCGGWRVGQLYKMIESSTGPSGLILMHANLHSATRELGVVGCGQLIAKAGEGRVGERDTCQGTSKKEELRHKGKGSRKKPLLEAVWRTFHCSPL